MTNRPGCRTSPASCDSSPFENRREQAFGPRRAKILDRLGETRTVHFLRPIKRARKHCRFVFRQPIEIVQQIDQQDFLGQPLGYRGTHPEIIDTPVEGELVTRGPSTEV